MNASGLRTAPRRAATSRPIPLGPAEIHVWLAFDHEITEERLCRAYRKLLDAAEREQERRFYFAGDRHRYLVTRALVRTVLSRYAPIHPKDWMFSANRYGRPDIANTEVKDGRLSFNLSHTHGLIVLAVTRGRALGVDVENVQARSVSLEIADHYFAPQEVALLAAEPPQQRQRRFFEYWTLKEAYIKARGMGLSLPLDKFSFHYPDDHAVEIAIHPQLGDDSARWQFWQFQPRSEYLVAICAERAGAVSPTVVVRQAIPMLGEKECGLRFLRASDPHGEATRENHERRLP